MKTVVFNLQVPVEEPPPYVLVQEKSGNLLEGYHNCSPLLRMNTPDELASFLAAVEARGNICHVVMGLFEQYI